jgi:hypothetical protein
MLRWCFFPVLLLAASCAGDPAREVAALEATAASARANLAAIEQRPAVTPAHAMPVARMEPASRPDPVPGPVPVRGDAAAVVPRSASQFMGAAPEALVAALGQPALRRDEGGASIWLYSGSGCHLDIVLYPTRDGLRVAHVEARAGGIAQRSEASCLRDLAGQRPRTPLSGGRLSQA